MKRLLALLLAMCLVLGLAACGPKPGPDDGTGNNANGDKPYAGQTLQIWAVTGENYESTEKINAKSWLFMMRAAMVEWAAKNDVTLEFVSSYNQQTMLAAINSGSKPDFVMATEKFPEVANLGLVQAFTDEQKTKISAVVGDTWFQDYKGKSYGVLPPWAGTKLIYFNLTMMENYGVKTPYDYIAEGNWTWDTFYQCAKDCTKDTNGDGALDTIGTNTLAFSSLVNILIEGADGKLASNLESAEVRKLADMLYKGVVEDKCILKDTNKTAAKTDTPRIAMSYGDAEPYNFKHLYAEQANGDIIATCMPPAQTADGDPRIEVTNYNFGIPNGSDSADAAVDMLCYILQCGMKFMADHSEGAMTTEFTGIEGTTEYSKAYKEKYEAWLEERDDDYEAIEGEYNAEFYKELLNTYNTKTKTAGRVYSGATSNPLLGGKGFEAMYQMPTASSMATLVPAYQALLDKYNGLFVF